jgi:hypothetical protein
MGEALEISPLDWGSPRLRPGGGHEGSWQLKVEHGPFVQPQGPSFDSQISSEGWSRAAARPDRFVPRRSAVLTGRAAEHALAILLPHLNPLGANRRQIRAAVNAIEEVGCPDRYFAVAEAYARSGGFAERSVAVLPLQVRLALEIAANEESERRAMEGELELLERAWRDAEEIATLAEDLVVPTPLRARLRRRIISD